MPDDPDDVPPHIKDLFLRHIGSNAQLEDVRDGGGKEVESRKAFRQRNHLRLRRLEQLALQLQEYYLREK